MRPVSRRQALRITAATGATLAMGGGLAWALFRDAGLHRVSRTRTRMGTQVTITVVHPEVDAARGMVDGAFAEVERLEGILSGYRADTPVTRLAREGIVRAAPPELIEVLVGRRPTRPGRTEPST